jgi:Uma2 family endonuclease
MSVDAFLNWVPQDGRKWQLIDGEPRARSPARLVHNHLQNKLGGMIENHLRATGRNCDVFANPGIIPATMSAVNMRIPDLAVSCTPYDLRQVAMTDPVAIIEILSPNNRMETWSNVWAYTSIPTVQDILVLRADTIGGDLLRRLPNSL